ncbi:hypothetical protein E4H12_08355 [Candidatus Thorarchaeota archaeon]|nr:MAG: hypothetical protein E4H12_08355 [Candidatus Thorarchaeota archaeon]
MIVNFRQGIVSYPVGFLTKVGTPAGSRVALNIAADKPLVLTYSHRNTNYVVVQKTSVGLTPPVGAFGPFLTGVDAWLYSDINLSTGVVTWGQTPLQPVVQATTPTSTQTIISDGFPGGEPVVQAGRHWFKSGPSNPTDDALYPPYTMFLRNVGNTAWEEKVRVFIAQYENGSLFISVSANAANSNPAIKFSGTQAGLTTTQNVGFLIYGSDATAYTNSDGTFVTTEDILETGMLLGADVKLGNYVIQGQAITSFPAYTMVRFVTFGKVTPVNLFNADQGFTGLVETAANIGDMVQVLTEGIITNGAWSWSAANVPIYVNNSGQLTETRPSINDAEPVGYALSATQMIMRSARIEVGLVDHATETDFGAVRLSAPPTAVPGYLDVVLSSTLGTTSTGLAVTNTYTAEMVIDGITRNIVYGPSNMPNFPLTTVPTFDDLITFLNTTLPASGGLMGAAVVSLASATALRVTSVTNGPTSTVRLTSGSAVTPNLDLFEALATYITIAEPVDGYYDSVVAVLVGGSLVLPAGTAAAPSLTFASDLTKGMYDSGAGEISFAIGGAQKVRFNASGVTTFSGFAQGSAGGMALWNTVDATTGISFATPGQVDIMVGGVSVGQFGGAPGPLTALVAGDIGVTVEAYDASILKSADIGVTVQAWDADLDAVSAMAGGDGFVQRAAGVWSAAALTDSQVNTALGYTAADASTLSTHTSDATIHFTEGSIDHTAIMNIGTNSHAAIDTHIADGTIHFTQGAISITASQVSDFTVASQAVPVVVTTQAAPYSVAATVDVVLATGTGNVTLPAPVSGKQVVVKNVGAGVVTVIPNAAETIDGVATFALPVQYDAVTVVSDGTDWFVI